MPVLGCAMPNKNLAFGCKVTYVPPNLERVVTQREGAVGGTCIHNEKEFGLHLHRVKDELQTVCNRHLMETPEPDVESIAWKGFLKRMRWLSRRIGLVRSAPISAVLKGKTGRRRKRFFQGIIALKNEGISAKDAMITEMQKLEMYEVEKIPLKEDRGIQYRSVKYNAALAREIHNIESRLIGLHFDGYHPVMKGATPKERAERIALGARTFTKPRFMLLDHSRFDAHVHPLLLHEEHKVYLRCRRRSKILRRLLRMQMRNKGRTKGGIRYVSFGKRMSGDINTGCGNTILNLCIILSWLDASGVKGKVYLDGDDSVVIIEQEDFDKLLNLEEFMRSLGMVTVMEYTDEFWKVEFCQSRPVLVDGSVRFVRNPHKVLATLMRTPERVDGLTLRENVRASCYCEMAMGGNCPVIAPFCRRVLNYLGDGRCTFNASQLWKAEQYGVKFELPEESEISDESRWTMWRAWGIDPGYQDTLENQDIVFSFAPVERKATKVKPVVTYDPEEEWSGYAEPACGCDACPTYDPEEAYEAARLW